MTLYRQLQTFAKKATLQSMKFKKKIVRGGFGRGVSCVGLKAGNSLSPTSMNIP